jgi:hypothetical protein
MNAGMVLSFASILFKSYIRANRGGDSINRAGSLRLLRPRVMFIVNFIVFAGALAFSEVYLMGSSGSSSSRDSITVLLLQFGTQIFVTFPVALLSSTAVAGVLFELGQDSARSINEAANWLPISSTEHVISSALSIMLLCSPLFSGGMAITLAFAWKYSLFSELWLWMIPSAILAFFSGSVLVELIKITVNRAASNLYRKNGMLGMTARLAVLVSLFALIQLMFNSYTLSILLRIVTNGISVMWFVPYLWPAVSVVYLTKHDYISSTSFTILSAGFAAAQFKVALLLRNRGWASSGPIAMRLSSSSSLSSSSPLSRGIYHHPKVTNALQKIGINPTVTVIALKEFRSLARRREMARFVAVPIVLMVYLSIAVAAPTSTTATRGVSSAMSITLLIPFMISYLLSVVSVGQEGKAFVNLCTVPVSARDIVIGKLLPVWVISSVVTACAIALFGFVTSAGSTYLFFLSLSSAFVILDSSLVAGSIGSRFAIFSDGGRSRFVSFRGFFYGLMLTGSYSIAISLPLVAVLTATNHVGNNSNNLQSFTFLFLLENILIIFAIGSITTYAAFRYCKSCVKNLTSNFIP